MAGAREEGRSWDLTYTERRHMMTGKVATAVVTDTGRGKPVEWELEGWPERRTAKSPAPGFPLRGVSASVAGAKRHAEKAMDAMEEWAAVHGKEGD